MNSIQLRERCSFEYLLHSLLTFLLNVPTINIVIPYQNNNLINLHICTYLVFHMWYSDNSSSIHAHVEFFHLILIDGFCVGRMYLDISRWPNETLLVAGEFTLYAPHRNVMWMTHIARSANPSLNNCKIDDDGETSFSKFDSMHSGHCLVTFASIQFIQLLVALHLQSRTENEKKNATTYFEIGFASIFHHSIFDDKVYEFVQIIVNYCDVLLICRSHHSLSHHDLIEHRFNQILFLCDMSTNRCRQFIYFHI